MECENFFVLLRVRRKLYRLCEEDPTLSNRMYNGIFELSRLSILPGYQGDLMLIFQEQARNSMQDLQVPYHQTIIYHHEMVLIMDWFEQRQEQSGSVSSLLTRRLSRLIINLIRGSFMETCRQISLTVPFLSSYTK